MIANKEAAEQIVTCADDIKSVRIQPVLKRQSYFLSHLTNDQNQKIVIESPLFISSGFIKQNRYVNNKTLTLPIKSDDFPGLNDILTKMNNVAFIGIMKACEQAIKDNMISTQINELSKTEPLAIDRLMKPHMKNDTVMWARADPDALVFDASDCTTGMAAKQWADIHSGHMRGVYKVRIVPQYVYYGSHGTLSYACSISYRIDQVLYKDATISNTPITLKMDPSVLNGFETKALPSVQTDMETENDDDLDKFLQSFVDDQAQSSSVESSTLKRTTAVTKDLNELSKSKKQKKTK